MNPEKFDVKEAVAKALEAIRKKSFAERHPELGKMLNCPVCSRRHRGAICAPKYAQGRVGSMTEGIDLIASQKTARGVMGASRFAKKRFHPHPSKRKLQLVQRTQEMYFLNEPYFTDAQACMEESRDMAQRQLKKERNRKERRTQKIQQLSRRINAGLIPGGTRVGSPLVQKVTPKTYQNRKAKLEARTKHNKEVKDAGPF